LIGGRKLVFFSSVTSELIESSDIVLGFDQGVLIPTLVCSLEIGISFIVLKPNDMFLISSVIYFWSAHTMSNGAFVFGFEFESESELFSKESADLWDLTALYGIESNIIISLLLFPIPES